MINELEIMGMGKSRIEDSPVKTHTRAKTITESMRVDDEPEDCSIFKNRDRYILQKSQEIKRIAKFDYFLNKNSKQQSLEKQIRGADNYGVGAFVLPKINVNSGMFDKNSKYP